ncbi:MAG: sugar transferase [Eubacteriales bacterium]
MKYYPHIKRILDLVLSLFFTIALFPLLLVVTVILLFTSGVPVIFTQKRIGKGGKPFMIYKFRTMKSHAPELPSRHLHDEEYVSSFGRFLRRTGIDELPQLINIIKGDMSIVGARPLITDEKEIHELRTKLGVYKAAPGLTGLAQISCDKINSLEEKAQYDAKYTDNITFKGDMRIVLATVGKMFSSDGIKENIQ